MRGASMVLVLFPALAGAQTYADAGLLAQDRSLHSATLMSDGRVLVAGGSNGSGTVYPSSEIFDPLTTRWSPGPALRQPREVHGAVRLWDGRILLLGGNPVASAEAYDPALGQFVDVAAPAVARYDSSLTLLANGSVLVVSGRPTRLPGSPIDKAERFDVASASFVPGGTGVARDAPCTARLPDGRVLVLGGETTGSAAAAEIFDGDGGVSFAFTTSRERRDHACAVLPGNQLLVVGGRPLGLATGDDVEVYDLATGTRAFGFDGGAPRFDVALAVTPSGEPWWTGGKELIPQSAATNLFVRPPAVQSTTPLPTLTQLHTMTVLPTGRILIVPGTTPATAATFLADFRRDAITRTTDLPGERASMGSALLPDGRVLVVGGHGDTHYYDDLLLYDPATFTWLDGGTMPDKHNGASVTVLLDGRVLIAGGSTDAGRAIETAFLFDPETGAGKPAGTLNAPRVGHVAGLMEDGTVLVAGGDNDAGALPNYERYDPTTDRWSIAGLTTPRTHFGGVKTPRGDLVLVGGNTVAPGTTLDRISNDGGVATAVLHPTSRSLLGVAVLPDGRVMVHGGFLGTGTRSPATFFYSPTTNSSVAGPDGPALRSELTLVRLGSGLMLLPAGDTPETVALFDPVNSSFRSLNLTFAAQLRSTNAVHMLSGQLMLLGGETTKHWREVQFYSEGMQSPSEHPVISLPCLSAAQGGALAFGGTGLWADRTSSGGTSQSSPDDLVVVAFEDFETAFTAYGQTVLDSLDAGRVTVPASLNPGWYRVFGIVRGNAGPGLAVRVGWPAGHGCKLDVQCGSNSCVASVCAAAGCAIRPAWLGGVGPGSDGGTQTDGGSATDGGTTLEPRVLRVGCGCNGGGPTALWLLALLGRLFRARRRAS